MQKYFLSNNFYKNFHFATELNILKSYHDKKYFVRSNNVLQNWCDFPYHADRVVWNLLVITPEILK